MRLAEARGALTVLWLLVGAVLFYATFDLQLWGQGVFQSARFHIAALAGLLALVLLALRGWRRGLLFALLAVASAGDGWLTLSALRDTSAPPADGVPVTVMSYNVLIENTGSGRVVADAVIASGADFVVLMEAEPVYPELARLAGTYPYRIGCDEETECDLTLFSRTPLDKIVRRTLGMRPNSHIRATTFIGGERVTIAAVHVSKPYFDRAAEGELEHLGNLLAYVDGPLLLAGDFNAAPWSGTVARLLRRVGLRVAQTEPLPPATWPVEYGPLGIPIDGIFANAPVHFNSLEVIADPMGSNHRGLMARFLMTRGAGQS